MSKLATIPDAIESDKGFDSNHFGITLGGEFLTSDTGSNRRYKFLVKSTSELESDLKQRLDTTLANVCTQASLNKAIYYLHKLVVVNSAYLDAFLSNENPVKQYIAIAVAKDLGSQGKISPEIKTKMLGKLKAVVLKTNSDGSKQNALVAMAKVIDANPKLATEQIKDFLIQQVNQNKTINSLSIRVAALKTLRSYQIATEGQDEVLEAQLVRAGIQTLAISNHIRHAEKERVTQGRQVEQLSQSEVFPL
ncbi:MAG: hypothetical protein KDD56_10780, partial [Bdellovibrionales bacterium]|nr:hypothetical protein [Bdellovibrionales bacterium]